VAAHIDARQGGRRTRGERVQVLVGAAQPDLEGTGGELLCIRAFGLEARSRGRELTADIGRIEHADARRKAAEVRCVVLDLGIESRPVIARTDASASAAIPAGRCAAELTRADAAAHVIEDRLAVEDAPAAADRDRTEGAAHVDLEHAYVIVEIAITIGRAETVVVRTRDVGRVLKVTGDGQAIELGSLEMCVELARVPSRCDARVRDV